MRYGPKPDYALERVARTPAKGSHVTLDFALQYEPRPRDFSARLRRSHGRSLGASKRSRPARHTLVLLGAVALPAFASPEEWRALDMVDAGKAEATIEPMPFEKPGSSFPGSAFYYLSADEPAPTPIGEGIRSDAEPLLRPVDAASGPLAGAMRIYNGVAGPTDSARALQCLTAAVYYEAASEPDSGQRAVAQVVLNRVAHPAYPDTVCGVVFQGSERKTGCQFSFTCDGALARKPTRMFWLRAEAVARAALAGYVHAPAGLATHYHTVHVHPYWADKLSYMGTIGLHRFYRFGGAAGSFATFRFAYGGGEPVAAPHPRTAAADALQDAGVIDPAAVQAAYDAGLRTAQVSATTQVGENALSDAHVLPARSVPAAAPSYTAELRERGGDTPYRGDRLPQSTGIRPEYLNSGRWIAQPGG